MMTTDLMQTVECNDAELVAESRRGNREAFRQIVERYQTLVCSLAYSATGNLSQSEDVAQETFLTAWPQLRSLREPNKLRAWLTGIARFKIQRTFRDGGREPIQHAAPLDEVREAPGREALPSEQAICREEEAILWRSLEKIPELYREPLILYYRQHQSLERVAAALELTEDAVKQRLSRGRKLLQEEVQAFVEDALLRTAPRATFSSAVVAMLPMAAAPVATAGLGAGAKGATIAKSGFLSTFLLPLAPFLGIAAGIGAQALIIRSGDDDRKEHGKQIALIALIWSVYLGLAVVGELVMQALARHFNWTGRIRFVAMVSFWWLFVLVTVTVLNVVFQGFAAKRRALETARKMPPLPSTPMNPARLALVVAGSHLMFAWMLRLTWSLHDGLATGVFVTALLASAAWSFFRLRGCATATVGKTLGQHLTLVGFMILVIINLRVDLWVATAYGVTVAEAHQLQPLWIIPAFTLILIGWTLFVKVLTRPKLAAT